MCYLQTQSCNSEQDNYEGVIKFETASLVTRPRRFSFLDVCKSISVAAVRFFTLYITYVCLICAHIFLLYFQVFVVK